MSKVIKEGYLTKLAIKSGRNWKKRYFMIRADGSFSYSDTKGDAEKNVIKLTSKSKCEIVEEIASEGGFIVSGLDHDDITVKARDVKDAERWIKKINSVINKAGEDETARRKNDLAAFASPSAKLNLFSGRKSMTRKGKKSSGSGRKIAGSPRNRTDTQDSGFAAEEKEENSYLLKVADTDNCYVNKNTLDYYKTKKDFLESTNAIGKAKIEMLV